MDDSNQNQEPVYKVPPNMVEEPLGKKKFPHLALGIVFLLAIAGAAIAGIYYWQTVRNIPLAIDLPQHKDPREDWKTYRDSLLGYEFKYPKEWSDPELIASSQLVIGERMADSSCAESPCYPYKITKLIPTNADQVKKAIEENLKIKPDFASNIQDYERESVRIITYQLGPPCGAKRAHLFYTDYMLDMFSHCNAPAKDPTFNLILSTFKFIELDKINSYSSCISAGFPISKSKPPKCSTSDGTTFVEPVGACIQVIATARNPQTGEVRDFPTPCDIPEGWLDVNIPATN